MSQSNAAQLAAVLKKKGIQNAAVLAAIANTPRHLFVGSSFVSEAYADHALPIGHSQTISQPFVVARMTELLLGDKTSVKNILEVGTGSGYQAAVLAQLADHVYTIERILPLYERATKLFADLKINNIQTRFGDGNQGWPEVGLFDGIIVTAASKEIPQVLLDQLADHGRMVVPIGVPGYQELYLIEREGEKFTTHVLDSVVFVPLLSGTEK